MKRFALLGGFALLLIGLAIGMTTGGAAPGSLTFDGDPAAPLAISSTASYDDLDIQVHSRNPDSWSTLPPINAEHGPNCEPPPATHVNTSYENSVFQCKNHVMTAINGAT